MIERQQPYTEDIDLYKTSSDEKKPIEYKNPIKRRGSSLNIGTNSKYQSKQQESSLNKGIDKNKAHC